MSSPYLPGPMLWLDDDVDPAPSPEPVEGLYIHAGAVSWWRRAEADDKD